MSMTTGIIVMVIGIILVGMYFDIRSELTVNIKNVGDSDHWFVLYLDGDEVMNGTLEPDQTVTFILHEDFFDVNEDDIFICSLQVENTIFEREVHDYGDEWFLID